MGICGSPVAEDRARMCVPNGLRTGDIAEGRAAVSTAQMGAAICGELQKLLA